jgi:hypothetical protein
MTRHQMNPSPISRRSGVDLCLTCTAQSQRSGGGAIVATDPVAHVEECHPEATHAVRAQFAPRHQRIVRTAR